MHWIVLVALACSLSLQTLGPFLWADNDPDSRSLVSLVWLIGPAVGWIFGGLAFLRNCRVRNTFFLNVLWIGFLIMHSFWAGLQGGVIAASAAFLSWGAWFGIYLWLANSKFDALIYRNVLCSFWILLGIVLTAALLFEAFSGSVLVYQTTIGDDLARRQGFSQSVAVAAIQIGCGLIALGYFMVQARSRTGRLVLSLFFGILAIGLLLTTARGPLLLVIVCLGLFFVVGSLRKNQKIFFQIVIFLTIPIIAIPVLIQRGYLNTDSAGYVLSALTSTDESNQVRVERIKTVLGQMTTDRHFAIFGRGLGETGVLARTKQIDEVTSESSLLRIWLDGGWLGLSLFLGICLTGIIQAMYIQILPHLRRRLGANQDLAHLSLLLLVLFVFAEISFHDMLTTWIISGIFWSNLGMLQSMSDSAMEQARKARAIRSL